MTNSCTKLHLYYFTSALALPINKISASAEFAMIAKESVFKKSYTVRVSMVIPYSKTSFEITSLRHCLPS
jgi:hypothetical protein